jgi:hypothetical protein
MRSFWTTTILFLADDLIRRSLITHKTWLSLRWSELLWADTTREASKEKPRGTLCVQMPKLEVESQLHGLGTRCYVVCAAEG